MNKIKFIIEMELTEDQLVDLLCNATGDTCGFSDYDVEYQSDYAEAKAELLKERNDKPVCIEEVWARVIFKGKRLKLTDEDDGEFFVGIQDIVKGLQRYVESETTELKSINEIIERGDFWDADAVMQYAVYGEIIYG